MKNIACRPNCLYFNLVQVHERTEELDFLLLVIRKLLRTNSRYVKVCSAHFNSHRFCTVILTFSIYPTCLVVGHSDVRHHKLCRVCRVFWYSDPQSDESSICVWGGRSPIRHWRVLPGWTQNHATSWSQCMGSITNSMFWDFLFKLLMFVCVCVCVRWT